MDEKSTFESLRYFIHAFGCQMNKHDSERVCGMLDQLGAYQTNEVEDSDIVIFLTCCVREAADSRLFGQLESLKNIPLRKDTPLNKRFFVLGGCIAQRDKQDLLEKYNFLDVVIGTQVLSKLPNLLENAMTKGERGSLTPEKSDEFSTSLPSKREQMWAAWLPITSGCNNFCTYCIVPYVRGREKSREFNEIVSEAKKLKSDGVIEITLLGQNVNSYGRDLYGKPRFAELLKAVAECGIERLRFVTSHPKDLNDEIIAIFSSYDNIMPALHLPVQSGSNKILEAMNRKYTSEHYLELVSKLKASKPNLALSTDIIVGFPGETEEDFEDTLSLVKKVEYASAFTFIYSKRKGTPAAKMPDNTPKEVIQERYNTLCELVATEAFKYNKQFENKILNVLVEGTSKKDERVARSISEYNQVVHFPLANNDDINNLQGKMINVQVNEAKTWYLSGDMV